MGVCLEPEQGKLIMVTELMPRGSVFDLLHNSDGMDCLSHCYLAFVLAQRGAHLNSCVVIPCPDEISFKQRMRFARDTALGVNWLHLSNPPILYVFSPLHPVL
jgi:hypothetical protein